MKLATIFFGGCLIVGARGLHAVDGAVDSARFCLERGDHEGGIRVSFTHRNGGLLWHCSAKYFQKLSDSNPFPDEQCKPEDVTEVYAESMKELRFVDSAGQRWVIDWQKSGDVVVTIGDSRRKYIDRTRSAKISTSGVLRKQFDDGTVWEVSPTGVVSRDGSLVPGFWGKACFQNAGVEDDTTMTGTMVFTPHIILRRMLSEASGIGPIPALAKRNAIGFLGIEQVVSCRCAYRCPKTSEILTGIKKLKPR